MVSSTVTVCILRVANILNSQDKHQYKKQQKERYQRWTSGYAAGTHSAGVHANHVSNA
jgi:hypothetical protein